VAGAVAARREAAQPHEDERRRLAPVPSRRPRRLPSPAARPSTATWVIVFAVVVALLAVGRVTLSFAVVQKSLQTDAVVHQQRAVRSENATLAEQVAELSAAGRVRARAVRDYHLVQADDVRYVPSPAQSTSARSSP
jgi:hypothetical protein